MTQLVTVNLGGPALLTARATGATWVQRAITTPLAGKVRRPTGVALLAAWDTDTPPDLPGWQARLEPLRIVGAWPELGDLAFGAPAADGETVAVMTLAHPRVRRLHEFLPNSGKAERAAVASPAMVYGTAMIGPPLFVATFSLWNDVDAMRAYVRGDHGAAMQVNVARPFHRDQAFVRFRPSYARLP